MNLLRHFILLRFLFFLVILTTLFACNKTNKYDLGEGLSQSNAKVRYLPNLPVNVVTIKSDSAATGTAAYQLAGEYYDPYFGKHKAFLMAEFALNKDVTTSFDGTPYCDSIVWCIAYNGYYGDVSALNGSQTFKIYEITTTFGAGYTYYSNDKPSKFMVTSDLVGTATLVPNPTDSVKLTLPSTIKKAPHIRLKLNSTFGTRILNDLTQYGNSNFYTHLKGLMLYPDNPAQTSGQGAIFSFDLLNPASKLFVYYHDDSGGIEEFDGLYSTNTTQRASIFSHDFTNSAFAPQLAGTATDTNRVYIQSMTSTMIKVEFPIINAFKDSGIIVVNKAEVTFQIDDAISNSTKYPGHERMYLLPVDSVGKPLAIADQQEVVVTYYGYYDSGTHAYKFNIGRYFQDVLNGKIKNYGMRLLAASSVINSNRTILKTKENIIFNLTYTKF